jgi:two-component system NtrC family sensor kinase
MSTAKDFHVWPGGSDRPSGPGEDDPAPSRSSVRAAQDLERWGEQLRHAGASEQWLAVLIDSLDCGVLLQETDGRIRSINARLLQLLGVEPGQREKLPDFESLLAAVRDNFADPTAALARWLQIRQRGDEVAWEEVELAFPGERRVLERCARPVHGTGGERIGWLELYRDVTSERLLQVKLQQAGRMAALGHFVSGIAHELNNPLTGITGYAQRLLARPLEAERASEHSAGLRHIFDEAQRAGRIVRNLLLFAREEKPEHKPVSLNEIVVSTVALRQYELELESTSVQIDLADALPAVLGDAHQLQQVVLNLVVNAEQALQLGRGKGHIHISTRRARGGRVRLEVRDDGPGIPREVLPRIFDPFFTTKPAEAGTGLGLSIVCSIVQEHKGEVRVESTIGRGTTFIVELPAAVAVEAAARGPVPVAAAGPARPSAQGPGRRILVVEDEQTVASLVADVLREEGHRVTVMLDSVQALDRLTRESFDLLVLDLKMPHLDGRALYEEALRRGRITKDRVLFITGDILRPRTVEFLARNALSYVAKPFLVEELTAEVRRLLAEAGAGEQQRLSDPRATAVGE